MFNSSQSVSQFSRSVMSDSLRPHESQHTRPPVHHKLPELTHTHVHRVGDAVQPSHPLLSLLLLPPIPPSIRRFPMSQLFASGGQSIGVSASASVLPMSSQDSSALGWTGWISLQSKGLSRVFSNTTGQKHQFFLTQALKTLLIHLKQVSFYFNMSKYVAFSSTCYIIFLWKEFGLSW